MHIMILFISLLNLLAPHLKIENAWIRTASNGMNSALYFDINNMTSKDDQLINVSSDIAKIVQIHETYMQGENMGMRKVDSITIKSKSIFHLSPGGFHVMIIRLKENLRSGDKKEFTLTFRNAGKIKVKAEVKSE
jgi:periplasmic copper chaperone A